MYACCSCGNVAQLHDLVQLPRDPDTQQEWSNLYQLALTIEADVIDHYICKSHTFKKEEDTSESEFVFQPMEVKEELEDPIDQPGLAWREAKEEPQDQEEEIDYAALFPFEAEQTSYETYTDDTNYNVVREEDDGCQPTTSTAGTSSITSDETPYYYPELADGEIYAFCVKTSNNISGYTSFECGLCPQDFASMETRQIRRHLYMKHPLTMRNVLQKGYDSRVPKSFQPLSQMSRQAADQALCQFFLASGLPMNTVNDRNLESLAFNFNSDYTMPTIETLYEYTKQIADSRMNSKIEKLDGPLTVTFDTTSFNNRHYLAFSVHYRSTSNAMKTALFLRELEPIQPIVPTIVSIIRKEAGSPNVPINITNIVSGKADYEDALEDLGCFKQVMVCFSQNINKFADALISSPVFATSLKTLREFIKKFPTHRDLWSKFKGFIVKKRTYGEYPELDEGHWFTTLDFLTKCLHMHRLFSEFAAEHSRHLKYIGVEDNVNMVYLHSLLNLCKATLKDMVDQKATIVQVIPSVEEISASLGITTSRPEVIAEVTDLFNRLLLPFVEQSDLHRFALFLHPNYHGGSLLPGSEWNAIKLSIARQIALREAAYDTTGLGSAAGPSLRAAEKEAQEFRTFASRVRNDGLNPQDWWERISTRFPRLYKYARELLQIPAFAVNAPYYLGEYGLLTYSLQEVEPAKRSLMLRASGEMVEYRSKGDIMAKQICVKRKRDLRCPEDSWYTPIDVRSLRAPDMASGVEPVMVPLGQFKKQSVMATYQRAGMYSQLGAQGQSRPKRPNEMMESSRIDYTDLRGSRPQIKKPYMNRPLQNRVPQATFVRTNPHLPAPSQARFTFPTPALLEPKVEPKTEPSDDVFPNAPNLNSLQTQMIKQEDYGLMSVMPKRVEHNPKFLLARPKVPQPVKAIPFGAAAPFKTVVTLPTSQKKYYAVKTVNSTNIIRRAHPNQGFNGGPVLNNQSNKPSVFHPASKPIPTPQARKVYYVRSGARTGPPAEK